MNRCWGWLTLAVVAGAFVGTAVANEAPIPLPPRAQGLPLVIRVDPNARVSRLILPPEAAGGEGEAAPAPRAVPPGEGGYGAPAQDDSSMFDSTPRTIVAGLCLSLAAVGLFFVTRVQGSAKLLVIGLVSASALAGGAAAWADIAPGPGPRPPRPLPPPPQQQARVVVEWTGRRGAPVTLILAAAALQVGPPGAGAPPQPGFGAPPPPPPREGGFGSPPPEFDDVPVPTPPKSSLKPVR